MVLLFSNCSVVFYCPYVYLLTAIEHGPFPRAPAVGTEAGPATSVGWPLVERQCGSVGLATGIGPCDVALVSWAVLFEEFGELLTIRNFRRIDTRDEITFLYAGGRRRCVLIHVDDACPGFVTAGMWPGGAIRARRVG